ncbi:PP0621 family protein [Denitratisoma sp. agr-D3]
MVKWLFLSLVVLVCWGLIRSRSQQRQSPRATPSPPASSAMVPCAQCRVYVPKEEAVVVDGQTFCCREHQQRWERRA